MEHVLTALAVLIWMALGALIAVAAMAVLQAGKEPEAFLTQEDFEQAMTNTLRRYQEVYTERLEAAYAPFSERLGKPCWVKCGHGNQTRWKKHRVVAVSHKGAVNVRPWGAANGATWIPKGKVGAKVRWEEVGDEQASEA